MSFTDPNSCDKWLSLEDIIKSLYVKNGEDGYLRTHGTLGGDSVVPVILSAEVGTFADDIIVLTYDEPLDPASVPNFLDYAPSWAICPATITGVSIIGSTVHLQLSEDMYAYETIQLAYTAGANPVQDLAGNVAADFAAFDVTNNVTPEAQYVTVWNAFPTKPSAYNSTLFNRWMKRMVDNGHYAKAEFLDLFVTEHQDGSLFDWHGLTFNPSAVNAPAWGQYLGYTGNSVGGKYIRSNFNPTTNGTLIGQDNICAIIGIGNDVDENACDFGVFTGLSLIILPRLGNTFYYRCNANTSQNTANLSSKKYYTLSRGNAANYDSYINLVKTNNAQASGGLPISEIYICGSLGYAPVASNRQLRFAFLFSYLTEPEVNGANGVIPITEELLDGLGTGLY